jgi:hypothetical protein
MPQAHANNAKNITNVDLEEEHDFCQCGHILASIRFFLAKE